MKRRIYVLILSLILSSGDVTSQIGNPAPDFKITDVHGKIHRLYDYLEQGKTVVLDFFFTTCIPCQYYAPQVNKAYHKYGCNTQDVIFLSIDYNDTDAEVKAYEEQYKIEFPSASGKEGGGNAVVSQYKINAFPTFLVIDSTKKIIDKVDPPTLIVFDFVFGNHGISPKSCLTQNEDDNSMDDVIILEHPVRNGSIQLVFNESESGWEHFELLDYSGRRVTLFSGNLFRDSKLNLEVRGVTNGMYFLKLNHKSKLPLILKLIIAGH